MNLMIQANQICLIVKLYNNRPELLPDSNVMWLKIKIIFQYFKDTLLRIKWSISSLKKDKLIGGFHILIIGCFSLVSLYKYHFLYLLPQEPFL